MHIRFKFKFAHRRRLLSAKIKSDVFTSGARFHSPQIHKGRRALVWIHFPLHMQWNLFISSLPRVRGTYMLETQSAADSK